MHNGKLLPFALAVAMVASNGTIYPMSATYNSILLTNFLGPTNTIRHISAIDVLQKSSQFDLAGQIVLIGGDVQGLAGYETTPFGRISNTEIQANIVENLLQHNSLAASFISSVAVLSIFGMTFFALLIQGKIIWGIATSFVYLSLSFLAFKYCFLLFPVIPFVLVLGLNIWVSHMVKRKLGVNE